MSNPILQEIARLRRRVAAVELWRALLGTLAVAILVAGAGLIVGELVNRLRMQALAVSGGLTLIVLAIGFVRGIRAGRREDIYLAKWLDLENKLDDRLASALEFQRTPEPSAFMRACIDSIVAQLNARPAPLALPKIEVGRGFWRPLASLGVVALAFLGVQLRGDSSVASLDARRRLKVPRLAAQAGTKAAAELARQSDPELKRLGAELNQLVNALHTKGASKEEALRRIAEIEQQMRDIEARRFQGGPGQTVPTGPIPPGLVQKLADAMSRRDLNAVTSALQKAAKALARGKLTADEVAALAQVLRQLEQVVAGDAPGLTPAIDAAALSLEKGEDKGAAQALNKLADGLPAAASAFDGALAIRQALATVEGLKEAARKAGTEQGDPGPVASAASARDAGAPRGGGSGDPGQAGKGAAVEKASTEPDDDDGAGLAMGEAISSGRGLAPGGDPRRPGSTSPADGKLLHVAGQWRGKTLRELVFSGSADPKDKAELKQMVAHYVEVAQDRLRREEIPAAYSIAVRRYFDTVSQQGQK